MAGSSLFYRSDSPRRVAEEEISRLKMTSPVRPCLERKAISIRSLWCPNEDFTVWSVETNVDGEWKIRMNADWGINYGGALLNPTFDEPNFSTKGNALVTINFAGHHPVIKLKAK